MGSKFQAVLLLYLSFFIMAAGLVSGSDALRQQRTHPSNTPTSTTNAAASPSASPASTSPPDASTASSPPPSAASPSFASSPSPETSSPAPFPLISPTAVPSKSLTYAATSSPNPSPNSNKSHRTSTAMATAPVLGPSASLHHRRHNCKKKAINWLMGFPVGSIPGVIASLALSVLFRMIMKCIRGRHKNTAGPSIYSHLIKRAEDLSFLEKDEGLASLELIGRGGCGQVYKAQLPPPDPRKPQEPGKLIAIKKITKNTEADAAELSVENSKVLDKFKRQIRSEIRTVGQIRHRNLVPLLAHVPRPDCDLLVYEYMKNGSLEGMAEGRLELDWLARYRIALGVASGLEYLHMQNSPRIIHRDLKPANILLDDDMEARIGYFGLAILVPDGNTHMTMSNVAGTLGYIAPEYFQWGELGDKCDIYSFGVILGVLVIGKQPSDAFFLGTGEMSLVRWMRNVMRSVDPTVAIDPKLIGNGYEEQMLLVLRIACLCTADDPNERPNSKEVRCMLSQIKH